MIVTTFLCKFILSNNSALIEFFAIDMQTNTVMNSTLNNGNMKVFRTFIFLDLHMVLKDAECPTYNVSITSQQW